MLVAGFALHRLRVRHLADSERKLSQRVDAALAQIKVLKGLLPVCASCKKIRDDHGYWSQMEAYISTHSHAEFSHGICPDCAHVLYPEFAHMLNHNAATGSKNQPQAGA